MTTDDPARGARRGQTPALMKGKEMERSFVLELDTRKASPTDRTIQATISSETPVERPDGAEILSHAPGAVGLSRFPLPLCISHNTGKLNVGLVEKPILAGGRLRATLRFGTRQEATEIWTDVQGGVLRYLSVGYQVDRKSIERRDDGSFIVHRWQPYETSIVSAPADMNAIIGRAHSSKSGAAAPRKAAFPMEHELNTLRDKIDYRMVTNTDESRAEAAALMPRADVLLRGLGHNVSYSRNGWRGVEDFFNRGVKNYIAPDASEHRFEHGEDYSRRYEPTRRGFGEYLRDIRAAMTPGGVRSERLDTVQQRAAGDGLTAFGNPSDGGFLVADEHHDMIGEYFKSNDIIKRCRAFHPEGNTIRIPMVDETSRADGSRQGGLRGFWTSELGQLTSSAAKFKTINLTLEKLTALVYCSDEILEDYETLGQFVTESLARELLFKLQDGVLNGTGAGQPLGILNSSALVSIDAETGQAADTIVSENILKMYARFQPSGMPGGCCWVANRSTLPMLWSMTFDIGTGGELAHLYQPGNGPDAIGSMLGYPVIFIEQAPTLGDAGDIMLVDLKQYLLLMKRGGVRTDMSIHLKFDYGQSAFRAVLRCEGQPAIDSPITPFKGTDTVSPFIAIAARE